MQHQHPFPDHLGPLIKQHHVRLHQSLMLFWGSKEFNEFLDKTTMMTSDRINRQGFTPDVMKELFSLQKAHAEVYPCFTVNDIWSI